MLRDVDLLKKEMCAVMMFDYGNNFVSLHFQLEYIKIDRV
jgi:hypothetical protein